jgi:hypothetical protein
MAPAASSSKSVSSGSGDSSDSSSDGERSGMCEERDRIVNFLLRHPRFVWHLRPPKREELRKGGAERKGFCTLHPTRSRRLPPSHSDPLGSFKHRVVTQQYPTRWPLASSYRDAHTPSQRSRPPPAHHCHYSAAASSSGTVALSSRAPPSQTIPRPERPSRLTRQGGCTRCARRA